MRSLSANYDKLSALLSNLNFKFSVIGLTETKISMQKSLVSSDSIDGYHLFSQPSHQNAGGVGLYIRDDCEFHVRDDFTVSTNDFECLSLEIHCQSQSTQYHMFCNLQTSKKYLQKLLIKYLVKINIAF